MSNFAELLTLEVEWEEIFFSSSLASSGVKSCGYLYDQLIGYNGIILGDLISISDPDKVLEHKYESLRRSRRSNEENLQERYLGINQPVWSCQGPWRVVSTTLDGSLGVSLRINQNQPDLLVRPDQCKKIEDR